MSNPPYEYVVVGSGVGGLFTAALLASAGHRVCVLERHYAPGGYGHSFRKGDYTFCAQLHYIWNCGPGDDFDVLLGRLGLRGEITFSRLDPDGFDRLRFPSFSYDICSGFGRNVERLAARYPAHRAALARYFDTITRINDQLLQLPIGSAAAPFLLRPWRYWDVIRYRNFTTADLFDRLGLPPEVRSILAGQSFDLLVPPSQASLLAQAGLACGYDAFACVPTRGYEHLFATLVDYIDSRPGCRVVFKSWVSGFETRNGRVTAARTKKGDVYCAGRFLFNGDPQTLAALVDEPLPRGFRRKLDYEYSTSCFTLYLGVRGLDLEKFGFGNWNVWHYAHDDIEEVFRRQIEQRRLEDPSLFLSTPTLHHREAGAAPPGCQQLVVCAPCAYEHFQPLRRDRSAYLAERRRVTELILDQIERHYVPGLRHHLDLVVPGTPTTNERFVLAPRGNAYGAALTPRHFNIGKLDYRTPFPNLWLTGATAGAPSFAGGTHFALLLYEKLTGDLLRRGSVSATPPAAAVAAAR